MKKRWFVTLDTFSNDLVQYKGAWLMACKVQSIDLEMRNEEERHSIMYIFKQILSAFNTNVQMIHKKFPLDFSPSIFKVKSNIISSGNENVKKYGAGYVEYLEGITKDKLDRVNYLILRTNEKSSYEQARPFLEGIKSQLERTLSSINMGIEQLTGSELKKLFSFPDFIKEELDYFIYGKEFKRVYIVQDYPRNAHPNWLKPLLSFPRPIEITQHLHPFPKNKIIDSLELAISKLESSISMQENSGLMVSSELVVRRDDAIDLLGRLASGDESIIELGFYVTISADSLERLNLISYELESTLRQAEMKFRRSTLDVDKSIKTVMPLCYDGFMSENYTFDTKSLATLVPYTAQDYSAGGILYGVNDELSELISFDVFNLPNPNKIILGKSGFGKSTLSKLEVVRHIINGSQALIIDHNYEYMDICKVLGGQYIEEGGRPDWNRHLLVFSGDKVLALNKIWNYVTSAPLRERLLVIDEFHNILEQNKRLMLTVVREIRKLFTSPTLITQNVKEFLQHPEGQMIMDLCSIKIFMHQGENDMEEIHRLFDLSRQERMYLKTCRVGHGYIITDLFKTKFRVDYSPKEHAVITTNPREKTAR